MSPTITVMHADHVAALCITGRVYLAPALETMPARHPDRIHVEAKCLGAGATVRGDVPGPYDEAEAEAAAVLLTTPPRRRRSGLRGLFRGVPPAPFATPQHRTRASCSPGRRPALHLLSGPCGLDRHRGSARPRPPSRSEAQSSISVSILT